MFKITNGTGKHFSAKFDGQEYAFPVDTPVYCEDDVAMHIFGIGQHDKSAVLARHGWALMTEDVAHGMATLNKFKFEHVVPVYDAPLALVGSGPAPGVQSSSDEDEGADALSDASEAAATPRRGRPPLNRAAA